MAFLSQHARTFVAAGRRSSPVKRIRGLLDSSLFAAACCIFFALVCTRFVSCHTAGYSWAQVDRAFDDLGMHVFLIGLEGGGEGGSTRLTMSRVCSADIIRLYLFGYLGRGCSATRAAIENGINRHTFRTYLFLFYLGVSLCIARVFIGKQMSASCGFCY